MCLELLCCVAAALATSGTQHRSSRLLGDLFSCIESAIVHLTEAAQP